MDLAVWRIEPTSKFVLFKQLPISMQPHQYNPESKVQSKQWLPRGSAGLIKFKAERSAQKIMATVFWDKDEIILLDFLEGQKAISASYYEEVLRKLKTALGKKQ